MPTDELTPRIYLKFNGTEASEEVTDAIISVEVDDSLTLPDMFAVHLRDSNLRWVDDDTFSVGASVEISGKTAEGTETLILSGEITGIEPWLTSDRGPTIVLRGYDESHRLNRNTKTQSFIQMTDSDIAQKIARDAGLQSEVDSTSEVHDYVLQDNKTDWEFLIARAQRVGYRVLVKEGKLHFKQFAGATEQTPTVEWAEDLLEFNARLTTARQVSEVIVQGWDPDEQQQIVGSATRPNDMPEIGQSEEGGPASEVFGGSAREILVNRPVSTQAEADILAQSICDEIGQGFIEGECIITGNPRVQAGAIVEIVGVGDRFSGNYRVTHAVHRYDASGYKTEFSIGGRHAATIGEILSNMNGRQSGQGAMLGVVTNNEDPDDQGRVKVKIPSLKDSEESAWARLVTPDAGPERGFQWLPEVNDEVLVLFEHDDINRPLVIGGLWSNKNKPPTPSGECLDSSKVKTRQIVTRSGTKLVLEDDDNIITISNPDEKFSLKISEKDSKIEIISDGDVMVQAKQNASVKADKDINAEAGGNAAIKVTGNADVEANGNAKVKASGNLDVEGAQVTVKGTAKAEVSAPTLSLKGSAMVEIQGGVVKIN
ncbi:MAG: VgrG-related protein [Dehalococcoidia bacterium]